ncbi:MAG: MFS transporter [Immundisolibacter sp.]|uniref:MFS transporter n=1 Tax=Immundisolibacter sp. TaxID=1934948 RepID=UPI003EE2097D
MSDRLVARLGARIYYGWVVLGVATLGGVVSAGSSQMYMGSVLLAITQDTGWTNTGIAGALLAGTLIGGLVSPLAGAWVDRHGPRALMSMAAVVMAAGFALMGWSPTLAAFYGGYMLCRGAAQGAIGGAAQRAIAVHWFLHYRGRAMGIVSMSVPLGGAAAAFGGAYAMRHGWAWRDTFLAMGVITLVVLVPAALLLLRRSPEALGLEQDGGAVEPRVVRAGRRPRPTADEYPWTLAQALRTWALRFLMAGAVMAIAANGTVVFYHVTYLVSRGVSQVQAVTAVSILALSGALANIVWGYLSEFFSERRLSIISQLLAAAGVLLMLRVDTAIGAFVLSAVLGLLVRGEGSLTGLIVANYFGRFAFGRIGGLMASFQLVGLGLGPVIASAVYDTFHSYAAIYGLVAVGYLSSASLYLLARRPALPAQ